MVRRRRRPLRGLAAQAEDPTRRSFSSSARAVGRPRRDAARQHEPRAGRAFADPRDDRATLPGRRLTLLSGPRPPSRWRGGAYWLTQPGGAPRTLHVTVSPRRASRRPWPRRPGRGRPAAHGLPADGDPGARGDLGCGPVDHDLGGFVHLGRRGGEGVAERHREHPGAHEPQDAAGALGLADGPGEGASGGFGSVDADHDAAVRVGHRLGDGPVHEDWAACVGGAVLADRADEHPDEVAVATAPDHEQSATSRPRSASAPDGR